ncbi:MAG: phosphoribosylglycinamide formyltransferase [Cardiobacteriaceae bacterium]|nr:phosphoribosylglycinamide formyltransferase [Cardiobacteriaceae bacterium]
MTAQLTVLISGGGSNLAALLAACDSGELPARVVRVIADRDCAGKQHALSRDIPFTLIDRKLPRDAFARALHDAIPQDSDLVVLAGFLSICPPQVVDAFPRKIINLHPSLLPAYGGAGMYGLHVHAAVIAAGETESGCTVHYVDQGIDTGSIIAQARVPVLPEDDAHNLQRRIAPEEHRLLVHTVARLLGDATLNHKGSTC